MTTGRFQPGAKVLAATYANVISAAAPAKRHQACSRHLSRAR
jgi:hypothetical protein